LRKKSATKCTKKRDSNVKSSNIRSTWIARRNELKSELIRKSVERSKLRDKLNGRNNNSQSLIRILLSTRLICASN